MNFQKKLQQLILANSSQVTTLREKAINGNKQMLSNFCNVINSFLHQPKNQILAYNEINHFMVSANPQVITAINQQVFSNLIQKHLRKDLDQFIIFWKRIIQRLNSVFQEIRNNNILKRLQNIKINTFNRQLSESIKRFNRIFEQNLKKYDNMKVQFFQSFSEDSIVDSSVMDQNYQDIIQFDILQLKQIRKRLQSQQIDQLSKQQFLIKALNFINLRPKIINQKLRAQYNENRQWALTFVNSSKNQLQTFQKIKKQPNKSEANSSSIAYLPQQNQPIDQKVKNKIPIQEEIQIGMNYQQVIIQDHQQIQISGYGFQKRKANSKRYELTPQNNEKITLLPRENNPKNIVKNQSRYFKNDGNNNNQQNLHISLVQKEKPHQKLNFQSPNFSLKFIHSPEQMKNLVNSGISPINNQKADRLITLGQNSRAKKQYLQSPKEQDLFVLKHGQKQVYSNGQNQQNKKQQNERQSNFFRTPYNNLKNKEIINDNTGMNDPKTVYSRGQMFDRSHSPNTAFKLKTAKEGSTYKKLSEFNQQKKQRKQGIVNQLLTPIQDYLLVPYLQNFNNITNFNKFRRNCLLEYFTIYASPILIINCFIENVSHNKIKIQLDFQNKSNLNLKIQSIYRIPKSMKVQKYSDIKKKWSLVGSQKHCFGLQLVSFPLQPCLINLKYSCQSKHEDFKYQRPQILSLPATIQNFLSYLILSEQEWIEKWKQWSQAQNTRLVRNIILESNVVNQNQLISVFKIFTQISPVQGYSIKQFGGFCAPKNFKGLLFLLRISQRVGNIMTIQIIANRKINDTDEIDFLFYCLNIWGMLLAKIQVNFGQ